MNQGPTPQPKSSSRSKWNWVLRIFIALLALMAIGLASITAWVYTHQEKIKAMMIEAINQELQAEIKVEQLDLTLWAHFPYVAMEFHQVAIPGHGPLASGETLLQAQNLDIQFNLWDIFWENYLIRRIEIRHGKADVRFKAGTNGNYDLLKPKQDTAQSSSLSMDKLVIQDLELHFSMPDDRVKTTLQTDLLVISGEFFTAPVNLSLRFEGTPQEIYVKDQDYAIAKKISLRCLLTEDEAFWRFQNGKLAIEDMQWQWFGQSGDNYFFDFTGENLQISQFIALLPSPYNEEAAQYESEGVFAAHARIAPGQIKAEVDIQSGEIYHAPSELRLEDLFLHLQYAFENNTHRLNIPQVRGQVAGDPFEGSFAMEDMAGSQAQWQLKGIFNLAHWAAFFPNLPAKEVAGLAEVDIQFQGPLRPVQPQDWSQSSGQIKLQDVGCYVEGFNLPISQLQALVQLNEKGWYADTLRFVAGKSDFSLQGYVEGWLAGPEHPLVIRGQGKANTLHLDELAQAFGSGEKGDGFVLPSGLEVHAQVAVGFLQYDQFQAQDIETRIQLSDKGIFIQEATMRTCEGQIQCSGSLVPASDGFALSADGQLQTLSVQALFTSFHDFGQEKLTAKQVSGQLSGQVQVQMRTDAHLVPQPASTLATLQFQVVQGRLSGFEPLLALSGFIREEALKDIRFETLQNEVFIRDQQITMPAMDIRSNALNLVLSGTHGFDNQVDYRFNLLLKDLLASKFRKRKQQEAFGDLQEEPGGLRLYIKMSGPASDPKMAYDMQSVLRKIPEDLKREMQRTSALIREEFGLPPRDTAKRQEPPLPRRPNPNRVRNQDGFEFE